MCHVCFSWIFWAWMVAVQTCTCDWYVLIVFAWPLKGTTSLINAQYKATDMCQILNKQQASDVFSNNVLSVSTVWCSALQGRNAKRRRHEDRQVSPDAERKGSNFASASMPSKGFAREEFDRHERARFMQTSLLGLSAYEKHIRYFVRSCHNQNSVVCGMCHFNPNGFHSTT